MANTPDEHGMVVVDGVRYRPEDAPKTADGDAPAKKAPAKKVAPAAENKARVPETGTGAGESGTVPTK
ncbi:hypothetical protein [Nocardia sp. A7]|uniref:hypothetical protein n=1 Tax=Nocardia sp. A7 TaxID=2789274 RepID=UPI00397C8E5A